MSLVSYVGGPVVRSARGRVPRGVVFFVALLAACTEPPTPVEEGHAVPAAWQRVRLSQGHWDHLAKGNVTCRDCHDAASQGFARPGLTVCAKCHETEADTIHLSASSIAPTPRCSDCHVFDRARAPDKTLFSNDALQATSHADGCMQCHQEAQGRAQAPIGVHAEADCSACHDPHGTITAPQLTAACTDCHEAVVGTHGPLGLDGCADCHEPHRPAAEAGARCLSCHRGDKRPVTSAALHKGHDTCGNCHGSHQFTKRDVKPCEACHANVPVLAPSKHAPCISCHAPHLPSVTPRCESCHATDAKALGHPHPSTKGACVGCHPPHVAGVASASGGVAVACETCHAQMPTHGNATCRDCHTPHGGRPAMSASACGTCHADRAASTHSTGHAQCVSCHRTPGHGNQAATPACTDCHADIARTAGQHSDCASCHLKAAHQPNAAPATCTTCHAAKANQGHGAKAACEACHSPHGARGLTHAPRCETCHDQALPALHAEPAHRACASCHDGSHNMRLTVNRAACAKCHKGLELHEPNATQCTGCHPFRGVMSVQ